MRALLFFALIGCSKATPPRPPAEPSFNAAVEYEAAKSALGHGKLDEAVARFEKVASQTDDPDLRANAWLGLGSAYQDKKDSARALDAFEKLAAMRPKDPDAWRMVAIAAQDAEQRKKYSEALEKMIQLEPDDLKNYLDLAGLRAALGDVEGSKKVYLSYEEKRRQAIVQLAKSPDPASRADAAEALGSAKDVATARALVLGLTDRDVGVRLACAESLQRIGFGIDKEIAAAVKAAAEHEADPRVKAALSATR